MGSRKTILAEGQIYHLYNHASHDLLLFKTNNEYRLFLETAHFYLQPNPSVKYSTYKKSRKSHPIDLSKQLVTIICFCLMPNHYHFILKQEKKEGIRKYIQRLCNSYSHYLNLKKETSGSLFRGNFKAVRVKSNEQLLHLSRYIHLNPVSNYLVEDPKDWHFSSYQDYLGNKHFDFLNSSLVINQFQKTEDYKKFALSRKNYQRELERIKHLLIDN